ncbi:S9 family peptidase [Sphingobium lignivorans]|uniref:Dipeptidyl aminopeptidase/acylaminoacyl peptidase n=1 Tax=Sphingobium lignivorans TaxID=2735886 RepID=A0ABR6NDS1_9SPHN|nr:S9 family peptidase [Sphingobium lignivorans]MBB5985429.1 dipeptidyl aminopeptidase/acylaminoacyl peptidase [Sphingobium lignivorans]
MAPLLAFASVAPAAAQVSAEDIQRSVQLQESWLYLTRDVAEPAQWLPGGQGFTYRKTVEGGFVFVTYDSATNSRRAAFDQTAIAASLSKAMNQTFEPLRLPFERISYTADGKAFEFRYAEEGWRCTIADSVCAQAPRTSQPRGFGVVRDLTVPAINTPRRSPDGKWEAYVENFNIAIRPVGGQWKRISFDGSEANFYDPESIVWSPNSKKLAAYRVIPGYRREVTRVITSPSDQVQPKVIVQLYPKPGDPVDIDRPVLFHAETGKHIAIPEALFANPYRMGKFKWRKDSASFSFTFDQRGHQVGRLIEVDARDGTPRAAVEERAKTFINTGSGREFYHEVSELGAEVIWMSERDGWNHLYLIDGRTGKVKNQITRGDWVVREVVKVDDAKRQIWFAAGGMRPGEDPYLQHYYRVDFDGRNLTPMTTVDAYHDVAFSPDMSMYVDTYSRIDLPPVSELRRTSDGSLVATVEKADISRLVAAGFKAPEAFVAKGRDGKTDIYGVIVRPRDFDPNKTYPVVENIYAGPHSSFVPKKWWPFGYQSSGDKTIGMQSLADLGFIVVMMDGMGTLNRSKAFHDVAWKNIGDTGLADRILWHKAAAAKYSWYDIDRVGIYGGSAGGQNTLMAMLFHPEFYKVGIAYNGCHDNRMDKISWNEAWMGWPLDESYAASSGVDNAWRLQGKLMLVVGELDMNVDPASTYQVADALIRAGKDFDMLTVPGGEHGVLRSVGPVDYGLRRHYDYFLRHLAGVGTPDWNRMPASAPGGTVPAAH